METLAQERPLMTFHAELLASDTKTATVLRHDKAITISITAMESETPPIVSEVNVTISSKSARDLAKKLIKRLSELQEW